MRQLIHGLTSSKLCHILFLLLLRLLNFSLLLNYIMYVGRPPLPPYLLFTFGFFHFFEVQRSWRRRNHPPLQKQQLFYQAIPGRSLALRVSDYRIKNPPFPSLLYFQCPLPTRSNLTSCSYNHNVGPGPSCCWKGGTEKIISASQKNWISFDGVA